MLGPRAARGLARSRAIRPVSASVARSRRKPRRSRSAASRADGRWASSARRSASSSVWRWPTAAPTSPSIRRRCAASRAAWSSRDGTASSAATDGVAARTSAAKSARVTSDSWPTPTTTGRGKAATARTTRSSLNGQRSSSEPPPRARMSRSMARPSTGSVHRARLRSAPRMVAGAVSPWTRHGAKTTRTSGQRRRRTWTTSCRTAPVSLVASPIVRGQTGKRPLPGRLEEPLGGELRLHRLEAQGEVAEAGGLQRVDVELVGALLLEDVDPAVDDDLEAGLWLEGDARPVVAEDDAAQLRAGVLERQVGVTGGADADLADLALDPDVPQVRRAAQAIADDPGELGDRPDARSGDGAGVCVVAVVGAARQPGVPRPVRVGRVPWSDAGRGSRKRGSSLNAVRRYCATVTLTVNDWAAVGSLARWYARAMVVVPAPTAS